jgi:hypothetical protein
MSSPKFVSAGTQRPWSIAIFSSRETPDVLWGALQAVEVAVDQRAATLDVMVNGNATLAESVSQRLLQNVHTAPRLRTRVWFLETSDKSHAWNRFIHDIWSGGDPTFFIDGYAHVRSNALELLAQGLSSTPGALAASGVPTVGRSAKALREQMLRGGGAHGNLFALRAATVVRLRTSNFRLPLGLYRTDALLTSVICFDLEPGRADWDWSRIFVHPEATWGFRPLDWRRPGDLLAYFKRLVRHSQGELEKMAYKHHFVTRGASPESLPATSAEMVSAWRNACPREARKAIMQRPRLLLGLRRLQRLRLSSPQDEPRLIGQYPVQ